MKACGHTGPCDCRFSIAFPDEPGADPDDTPFDAHQERRDRELDEPTHHEP